MSERFRCARCRRTFEARDGDEARARQELRRKYPTLTVKDCVVMCSECQQFIERHTPGWQPPPSA